MTPEPAQRTSDADLAARGFIGDAEAMRESAARLGIEIPGKVERGTVRERLTRALLDALGWDWTAADGVPSPEEAIADVVEAGMAALTPEPTPDRLAAARAQGYEPTRRPFTACAGCSQVHAAELDGLRQEVERLTRIINGYDRTPAEQRAADAEATLATVRVSADEWWSQYDRELAAHALTSERAEAAERDLDAARAALADANARLAAAWDEGYRAGARDDFDGAAPLPSDQEARDRANPYRAALTPATETEGPR